MPQDREHGESRTRPSSWFALLDHLDLLLYGGLGLALLLYAAFEIGRASWESGSALAFGIFAAFAGLTFFALVRDLRRKELSGPTTVFLALWLICVAVISVLEFTS